MRRRLGLLLFLPLPLSLSACGTTPAAKSPLKDQLAGQTQHQIEESAMACLTQAGWQVDPFPENVGGMRRVRAVKKGETTELYIQPQGMTPRIQGGPDWGANGDPFWPCMASPPAAEGSTPAPSPSEKDDVTPPPASTN
jgi:hypothetical protein